MYATLGPLALPRIGCYCLVRDSAFEPCTLCPACNCRANWNSILCRDHRTRGGILLAQKLWGIAATFVLVWPGTCRYRRTDCHAFESAANFGFFPWRDASLGLVFVRVARIFFWDGFRTFLVILCTTPFARPISASASIVFSGRSGCISWVLYS